MKLFKSEYSKNVITLVSGTSIAQAIPVLISPILTRIYTPEEIGILALFLSIASMLGSFANTRYELGIIQPESDEDALNLTALSILLTTIISILFLILISIFNYELSCIIGNEKISVWLYFIPFYLVLVSLYGALRYFNIRTKSFNIVSSTNITRAIANSILKIGLGILKLGEAGLIISQLGSSLIGNVNSYRVVKEKKMTLRNVSVEKMNRLAKQYINFPKYSMPGEIIFSSNQNLISLFISNFFSTVSLGYYSIVMRTLTLPYQLIGGAIADVYFQRAMEEKNKTGKAKKTFVSTFKKLIIILPIFIPLVFFIEEIFIFVFGYEWKPAGEFAQIIIFAIPVKFVVTPLSRILFIFQRQKILLLWQILMLGSFIAGYVTTISFNLTMKEFLVIITSIFILLDFLLFVISYKTVT